MEENQEMILQLLCVKARKPEFIDLFTGPPKDEQNDSYVIKEFMKGTVKK